jgi:hypothetical protein
LLGSLGALRQTKSITGASATIMRIRKTKIENMKAKAKPSNVNHDVTFTENLFYERLIVLRRKQPEVFAALSPAARLTLGYYEAAKRGQSLLDDEPATRF